MPLINVTRGSIINVAGFLNRPLKLITIKSLKMYKQQRKTSKIYIFFWGGIFPGTNFPRGHFASGDFLRGWVFFLGTFFWKPFRKNCTSEIEYYKCSMRWLLLKLGSGPWKSWTLKHLDPQKHGSWKHGINVGSKNMPGFRQLCFVKTMRNGICCLKVRKYIN